MVAAGPVNVPVRELFLGGGAHRGDFDVEVEVLAGERMIAIERHHVAAQLGDGDGTRALGCLRLKLPADTHIADALERAARHLLHELAVVFAVTFGRGNLHLQPVAGTAARELTLEPRDQLAALDLCISPKHFLSR